MAGKPVTLAKISRPRLHDVLARTRLHGLLDKACERPIVWLSAQPGAGKTTLVAGHLEARKRPGIWYQVDAADADPASFIYHLRLAAQARGGVPADRLPLLSPEYLRDIAGFARRFFRDLFEALGDRAALVFDNFQEVPEDSAFHTLLVEGLVQVPEGLNVIVISRVDPPAAYAALLASDAIGLLDGEQLRLTLPETLAIAKKRGVDDKAEVNALFERSHGWAAGLTLLLTRTRRGASAQEAEDESETLQHVFGYFAQRVFNGAATEQREALMQLSLLPLITLALAEDLTGMPEVGRLLDHHYKRHLFTDRRRVSSGGAPVAVFQFHALFRTFLQHQARSLWPAERLRDATCRAGRCLAAAGHWEEALALYAQAADWAAYGAALASHAEDLLDQGRRETLIEWLGRMPEAWRHADPWLGYWQGRALMATAPDRALAILQAHGQRFAGEHNTVGQLACGAAVVQTLWAARLGWSEITPWVERLEPLLPALDGTLRFPSRAVELLSTSALHAALSFCRLAHPAIHPMSLQLLALVEDAGIAWDHRLATATHLIVYFHNAAEQELATQLAAKVDPVVESRPSSAQNRAFWYVFRAMHDLRQARYEEAAASFERAELLARREGLAHAEFAALQFRAYLDLVFGRTDDAAARIVRMQSHPARGHPDGEMNLCVALAMLAQQQGDAPAALGHARRGLQWVARIGAAYFSAVFPVLFAGAIAEGGAAEEALAIIAESRRLAAGSYLEAMEGQLLLEEALIHLVLHDREKAELKLARGLELAVSDPTQAAHLHRAVARHPSLLTAALQAGIETGFVRQQIRRWRVRPPAPDLPSWPWPVRVCTLGGFEVRIDDAPIEFGRKAPKKTLALLKAIVARGGCAPESALIDIFWSDEEGDAAARSLGAAVHRLRGLLVDGAAVVQQGGLVWLDRDRVWVDAWAFERALARMREGPAGRDAAAAEAFALYRGAFLAEEEGETWPLALRERLRSKFIQAVAEHAARLEQAGRDQEAIACYLRGLEADDVVEPFYQGLMRCYHRLDRLPEAVSAYRRLKQTLSITLSLAPSSGTEKLYRTLRLG